MSGGAFNFKQYELGYIADQIEQYIITNDSEELNEWGDKIGSGFSEKTIDEFKAAIHFLRLTAIYTQRVDWLVSGDDGEDSFHSRLEHDLKELQK